MNTCPKCHRPINEGNSPNLEECHAGDYDDDQQCELSEKIYQLRVRVDTLREALDWVANMPEYDQDDAHRLRHIAKTKLADIDAGKT